MNEAKNPWNQNLLSWEGSFLQSQEWAELQKKLGREVLPITLPDGQASIIKNPLPLGYNYFYLPRGPVLNPYIDEIKIQNNLLACLNSAQEKNQKSIFLRIEPQSEKLEIYRNLLPKLGFKPSPPNQPDQTLILDLNQTEEELLSAMKHGTRYSIRLAQKSGVRIKILKNPEEKHAALDTFWQIFQKHQNALNLKFYPKKYFENLLKLDGDCYSLLVLAYAKEKPIATALILIFGNTATYLYAALDYNFQKLGAPALILWEAMHYSKDIAGCAKFDFWGISNTNPSWQGFTAFKKSFGGKELAYPGTWDFVYHPMLYKFYKLLR